MTAQEQQVEEVAARAPQKQKRRLRDADRSRAAILESAEQLFAERGFDGASLAAIASAAKVSVGLPAYFFNSKEELYTAVLDHVFTRRDGALRRVIAEAEALLDPAEDDNTPAVRHLIGGYLDYLLKHPSSVWLLTRDALEKANTRVAQPRLFHEFVEGTIRILQGAGVKEASVDGEHLVLSIIAMCYFPLEHDATIVSGMGRRAWTPAFREQRVDHITRLLLWC